MYKNVQNCTKMYKNVQKCTKMYNNKCIKTSTYICKLSVIFESLDPLLVKNFFNFSGRQLRVVQQQHAQVVARHQVLARRQLETVSCSSTYTENKAAGISMAKYILPICINKNRIFFCLKTDNLLRWKILQGWP
jgi:hypothetical protein